MGQCDEVYLNEIGDTEVVIFNKKSESGHVATIIVRGSSKSYMDDIERAIEDAVNTYKALTKDNRVLLIFLIILYLINLVVAWSWCS